MPRPREAQEAWLPKTKTGAQPDYPVFDWKEPASSSILQGVTVDFKWRRSGRCRILRRGDLPIIDGTLRGPDLRVIRPACCRTRGRSQSQRSLTRCSSSPKIWRNPGVCATTSSAVIEGDSGHLGRHRCCGLIDFYDTAGQAYSAGRGQAAPRWSATGNAPAGSDSARWGLLKRGTALRLRP